MTPEALISVCVTCHNYASYVGEAIRSALDQTYPFVEVIAVDDGSTDRSWEEITAFGARIVAVRQERQGQAAASARAATLASGGVMVFLDADDRLEAAILRSVAAAFVAEPQLAMVQWRLREIDGTGADLGRVRPPRAVRLPTGDLRSHVLARRNWPYQVTSGCAYPRWLVERLFPPRLPDGEHGAIDLYLNELAPLLGPVRSLLDVGGAYRLHPSSLSAGGTGAEVPRRLMALTAQTHAVVCELAGKLGHRVPSDPMAVPDMAMLGWRLWSLRADADTHPVRGDRRGRLALAGARATIANPYVSRRHKTKRIAWFAAAAAAPSALLPSLLRWYAPDNPVASATS